MTLWTVSGERLPRELLESFHSPQEVLFEYNGPRIFSFPSRLGSLCLAYLCEEEDSLSRYIVTPVSAASIDELKHGNKSIRKTLAQPIVWIVDIDRDGAVHDSWMVNSSSLPEDALPDMDTMLLPSLEPLLSMRSTGNSITNSSVPIEAIKHSVAGVEKAFKILLDYLGNRAQSLGRPLNSIREQYSLHAQQLAFGSFEISFKEPPLNGQKNLDLECGGDASELFAEAQMLLARSIAWVSGRQNEEEWLTTHSIDDQRTFVEAVKCLTPSTQGCISEIELSGRIMESIGQQRVVLSKGSRRKAAGWLKRLKSEEREIFNEDGLIRELDLDRSTFMLREIPDAAEQKCSYSAEQEDDILEAFNEARRVQILGIKHASSPIVSVLLVSDIAEARENESSPLGTK